MKKSGYSLRLRPRERTNVGAPGSNNEATAKATASKRTVLVRSLWIFFLVSMISSILRCLSTSFQIIYLIGRRF